ncbi:TonB family protein [Brevundimonas bullata]
MPRGFIAATTWALTGGAALAGPAPSAVAQTSYPPPVIVRAAPGAPTWLTLREATLQCDGQPVKALYAEPLAPMLTPSIGLQPSTHELGFSIDDQGRPRSIRPLPSDPPRHVQTEEAQADLAAFRFAPGRPRADCAMTVRLTPRPLAEATTAQLAFAFAMDRHRSAAVARELARPDDDCRDRPGPAVAVYPSPAAGRLPPGARAWTVTRWNVGADGRTSDVETVASSGNAEVDAEARRAMVASTFQPDAPRRGCINAWNRQGDPLPDTPQPEPTGDPLKNCPAELRARFTHGRLTYPAAFQRRGIEGWAIVRYDIASWGETGAIEVLEAQPAAAFGDAARNIIRAGRATPGHVAGIRCTDRIIFRLPEGNEAPNTD